MAEVHIIVHQMNDLTTCDLSLYDGILVKQHLNMFGMQKLM